VSLPGPYGEGAGSNRIRVPDGKICLNDKGELAVTKFAVEPVCVTGHKSWIEGKSANEVATGLVLAWSSGAIQHRYGLGPTTLPQR